MLALVAAAVVVVGTDETGAQTRSVGRRAAPATANPISLSLSTDQPAYAAGETIHITAIALYGDGSAVEQVNKTQVQIKDGAGRRMARASLESQGSGTFTYAYATNANANLGSWQIEVEIQDNDVALARERVEVQAALERAVDQRAASRAAFCSSVMAASLPSSH